MLQSTTTASAVCLMFLTIFVASAPQGNDDTLSISCTQTLTPLDDEFRVDFGPNLQNQTVSLCAAGPNEPVYFCKTDACRGVPTCKECQAITSDPAAKEMTLAPEVKSSIKCDGAYYFPSKDGQQVGDMTICITGVFEAHKCNQCDQGQACGACLPVPVEKDKPKPGTNPEPATSTAKPSNQSPPKSQPTNTPGPKPAGGGP